MFQEKTGLSFMNNQKSKLRMLDFIEKQRKVLSGNSEASVNVECLVEDEDLNHCLSREDFLVMQKSVFELMRNELI